MRFVLSLLLCLLTPPQISLHNRFDREYQLMRYARLYLLLKSMRAIDFRMRVHYHDGIYEPSNPIVFLRTHRILT